MMENGATLSDIAAITNMNDGFGGNNGYAWIWILLIFGMFNGNGYGWGNGCNNGFATQSEMQTQFLSQNLMNRFDTLQVQQANNAKENAMLIQNALYDTSRQLNENAYGIIDGFGRTNDNLNCGFYGVNRGIAELGFGVQNVGCSINRNIDSVKFENAQNTCEIVNAIHKEGEITRGLIQQNTIQDLRDRLEEKDRLYQAANYTLANAQQTRNILDSVGRFVINPPQPFYFGGYGNYGYGYGGTTVAV